jgi:hypothetical protein
MGVRAAEAKKASEAMLDKTPRTRKKVCLSNNRAASANFKVALVLADEIHNVRSSDTQLGQLLLHGAPTHPFTRAIVLCATGTSHERGPSGVRPPVVLAAPQRAA